MYSMDCTGFFYRSGKLGHNMFTFMISVDTELLRLIAKDYEVSIRKGAHQGRFARRHNQKPFAAVCPFANSTVASAPFMQIYIAEESRRQPQFRSPTAFTARERSRPKPSLLTFGQYKSVSMSSESFNFGPRGYRSCYVGECINGCYTIILLLGHGTYSTVYLCWDQSTRDHRLVALKISRCAKHFYDAGRKESAALKRLSKKTNAVVQYLNSFDIAGEHGLPHHAVVTEVLGNTLYDDMVRRSEPYQLNTVIVVIAKILEALEAMRLSNEYHYDLKPENILLGCSQKKLCERALNFLNLFNARRAVPEDEAPLNFKNLNLENRKSLKETLVKDK
uniref:Protein kinase domain-containing protein n=1 Tax=Steinernema glaseri TaxID=37863 RepID=A0A1I8A6V8_9BILA